MYKQVPSKKTKSCADDDDAPSSSSRILVVADAMSNRKLLTRLLESGEQVTHAAKPTMDKSPWSKWRKRPKREPRMIAYSSTFEMPVKNGPQTAKELREMGCYVFFVGITDNLLQEDVSFVLSHGANAVLPKPIKMADLRQLWMEYGVAS